MRFYVSNFRWVMLISGLLTCTMLRGLFSPHSLMHSTFNESMQGPVAEIIIRNWSALIGLVGIMLIYGAFSQVVRKFVVVIAGISKIIFISLVLAYGKDYLSYGAGTAVYADSIMVLLYIIYLLLVRFRNPANV